MADSVDALFWRDELLQMLFWFHGEGLGDAVTARDLLPFLDADATTIQTYLDQLVEQGYVEHVDDGETRYQLTEVGVLEGGRRFADEFAGMTGQAHGVCNNPNCSCQSEGPEACEARTSHSH